MGYQNNKRLVVGRTLLVDGNIMRPIENLSLSGRTTPDLPAPDLNTRGQNIRPGIPDYGSYSFTLYYNAGDTSHSALKSAWRNSKRLNCEVRNQGQRDTLGFNTNKAIENPEKITMSYTAAGVITVDSDSTLGLDDIAPGDYLVPATGDTVRIGIANDGTTSVMALTGTLAARTTAADFTVKTPAENETFNAYITEFSQDASGGGESYDLISVTLRVDGIATINVGTPDIS